MSGVDAGEITVKYEVRSEGCVEADFDNLTEAKEFLAALDDTVMDLELLKVTVEIVETRNRK